MKLSKMALVAMIACGTYAGNLFADQTNDIQLVSCAKCDCGQPVCGCEAPACCDDGCCDSGCCDSGCDSCGCDSGCGLGLGGLGLGDCLSCGDCCLGEPYRLCDGYCGWSAGGWLQLGYTSDALPAFNTYDDVLQLQQAWLYAEKAIDTSCGFDIGGRIDYLYGTDGPNTQAFGTDPRGWDNDWDNGSQYGWAMPQLYLEAGYGDLSVKAGHFYTIIGHEVVPAPENFFYSHAYTFNFSEPFTHTGILANYQVNCDVNVWGGWTMGWDSGFDDNGDAWLGGISAGLTDDLTLIYASTAGRFGENRFNGVEQGYMQSIVADYDINDCTKYIFQTDWLDTETEAGVTVRDTFGINQYLIRTVNDCLSYGARFEWWQVQADSRGYYGANSIVPAGPVPGDFDFYALTLGVNYRPHANLVFRPELRFDWVDGDIPGLAASDSIVRLDNFDDDQTTFGVDAILTF